MADDVDLIPVDPFYRLCWEDGRRFDYTPDHHSMDAQIHAISPGDVEGYRRLLAYSEELYHEGYEKLGTVPFQSFWSMAKAAPTLMRLGSYRSIYSKVSQFIRNEKLCQAFSFHTLLVGGNPFATSSIYALIHALERRGRVWFARGGTGALIAAMVRLFEDLGGRLLLDTPVDRITLEGTRATGVIVEGLWAPFDSVASNADIVQTYRKLLSGTLRGAAKVRSSERCSCSMSLFVVYFGLAAEHPNLRHHMVLFGPR